jgi:hypothetical protein
MVTITYDWKHVGHTPGSIENMASTPIGRDARLALKQLVECKMSWVNIKQILRQDSTKLLAILDNGPTAPDTTIEESFRLTYDSVYYAMRTHLKKLAMLHPNISTSLAMWKDKIVATGRHCFTKNLDQMDDGMFMFSFCSQWQLNVS